MHSSKKSPTKCIDVGKNKTVNYHHLLWVHSSSYHLLEIDDIIHIRSVFSIKTFLIFFL